jgi:hypothetical protein
MAILTDSHLIEIKRKSGSSLDDLFGYTASDVENIKEVETIDNSRVNLVLNQFKRFVEGNFLYKTTFAKKEGIIVLSPKEINNFFQIACLYHNPKDKEDVELGLYLKTLIKKSYDSGNNNFNLTINPEIVLNSFKNILGEKYRPISLRIDGNLGSHCFTQSKYVDLLVKGNVGEFFMGDSMDSKVVLKGDAENYLAYNSINLTLTMEGNTNKEFASYAKRMVCAVDGNVFLEHNNLYDKSYFMVSDLVNNQNVSHFTDHYHLFVGDDAKDNPTYKQMMAEFDRRFGQ